MEMSQYVEHETNKYRPYLLESTQPHQGSSLKTNQQNVVVENIVSDLAWSEEQPYQVEDPKVLYINEYIVKHSLIDKEKILCMVCNVEFPSTKMAKKHSKIHNINSGHAIDSVDDSTSKSNRGSSNFVTYLCSQCNMGFNNESSLKKHQAAEHKTKTSGQKAKTATCDICYKSFAQAAHLTNHLLVHTGIRNYNCTFCDKKFKQRGHVLNHQKIHLNEKNYKCTECGKAFRQTAHLRTHMKIHTGIKDHVCIICNKVFTQSGQLQTHMRTHTNERKYECHLCDMKFRQSGHLQSHVKRHEKKNMKEETNEEDNLESITDEEDIKQEIIDEEIVE